MLALANLLTFPANPADAVSDFYRGKTVRVIIGFSARGGFDIYGWTVARYIGSHIPGNP
jgi:tripartite-type tricarboxylate transporter receptor subunit TctC